MVGGVAQGDQQPRADTLKIKYQMEIKCGGLLPIAVCQSTYL